LASFDFDQAEGLRRMLAGPKPRIVTFLSATPQDDKGAMLVNLGASLAQSGNDVLIVDACERDYGVAQRLGVDHGPGLLQVARQECALNQVIHPVPQGFSVVKMGHHSGRGRRGPPTKRAAWPRAFDVLVKQSAGSIVIVDGEFRRRRQLPGADHGIVRDRGAGLDQRHLDHQRLCADQAPVAATGPPSLRYPCHRRYRSRGEGGIR
jgi:flagellar biosynthesis protein FlhG